MTILEAGLKPTLHRQNTNGIGKQHPNQALLRPLDQFVPRHLGPRPADLAEMLATIGVTTLDALIDETIPAAIRLQGELKLHGPRGEAEVLSELRTLARQNKLFRSFIGMGYANTITPPVILRNILENPGWYTQYTPYQAEIAQGRLEALLNYQTMIMDLTGLEIANASLLDEGTAAAEAMTLCKRAQKRGNANIFFVAEHCHPQTIEVVRTRAEPLGYEVVVGDPASYTFSQSTFGVLLQYPDTEGDRKSTR